MNFSLAFVLIPLCIYIPLLCVETVYGFARLRGRHHLSNFFHVSWEITHTLLVFSVNSFVWLYADMFTQHAGELMTLAFALALVFIIRAIVYIYLYVSEKTAHLYRCAEYIFAFGNVALALLVFYAAVYVVNM
jgi:hypothetical protein